MNTTIARTALALVAIATPLAAQVNVRHGHGGRGSATRTASGDVGSILRGSGSDRTDSRRDRIPRGQLPPRGMCRVWIDGVPAGLQPAVTDCATAERQRLQIPNSRVIYGSDASFPGRGNGKFKNRRSDRSADQCAVWDVIVVGGRQVPVCRDQGGVFDRTGRGGDDDGDFDNEEDDDREENGNFQRGRGEGDRQDEHRFDRGRGQDGEHGQRGRRGNGRRPGDGGNDQGDDQG